MSSASISGEVLSHIGNNPSFQLGGIMAGITFFTSLIAGLAGLVNLIGRLPSIGVGNVRFAGMVDKYSLRLNLINNSSVVMHISKIYLIYEGNKINVGEVCDLYSRKAILFFVPGLLYELELRFGAPNPINEKYQKIKNDPNLCLVVELNRRWFRRITKRIKAQVF